MYNSYKRIGPISTGHRQYKADSHCRWIHGYGRYVELKFICDERDDKGWVYDFGNLKWFKKWLEEQWDLKVLVAHDDLPIEIKRIRKRRYRKTKCNA